MRDLIRDLILSSMEKTRAEISAGIQDAILPAMLETVQLALVAFVVVAAFAFFFGIRSRGS